MLVSDLFFLDLSVRRISFNLNLFLCFMVKQFSFNRLNSIAYRIVLMSKFLKKIIHLQIFLQFWLDDFFYEEVWHEVQEIGFLIWKLIENFAVIFLILSILSEIIAKSYAQLLLLDMQVVSLQNFKQGVSVPLRNFRFDFLTTFAISKSISIGD